MQSYRERFEQVAGPAPSSDRKKIEYRVTAEYRDGGVLRKHLLYAPEEGDTVPAWLLLPSSMQPKLRAALCLHQTTKIGKDEPAGLGGKVNLQYGRELALRGYITLCPDYPNFGEYRFDAYARGYQSTTRKAILNHMAAITLLGQLPHVDQAKIAAVGHSLGGHNALFLAAYDPRVRAVVSSCGFTSFAKYKAGDLTGWSHQGYMPRIAEKFGKSPARIPFEFRDVLAAISPRAIFVNAPLADDNFDWSGVDDAIRESKHPSIRLEHPDCAHDFPPEIRQQAYAWLDKVL